MLCTLTPENNPDIIIKIKIVKMLLYLTATPPFKRIIKFIVKIFNGFKLQKKNPILYI